MKVKVVAHEQVLIRLVLTEIEAFKNEKKLQRNVWKCGISIHFFVNFFRF